MHWGEYTGTHAVGDAIKCECVVVHLHCRASAADDWKCWSKFKGLPLSPEVTRRHGDGTIVRKMATRLLVAGAVLTMMLLAVKHSGDVALTQTTGTPVGHGMFLSRHEMNDMSLRKLREDHDMLTKRLSCVLCADERARER